MAVKRPVVRGTSVRHRRYSVTAVRCSSWVPLVTELAELVVIRLEMVLICRANIDFEEERNWVLMASDSLLVSAFILAPVCSILKVV